MQKNMNKKMSKYFSLMEAFFSQKRRGMLMIIMEWENLNLGECKKKFLNLVMGWQWGQGPWKRFPYIQVSDVLCYKPIPIILNSGCLIDYSCALTNALAMTKAPMKQKCYKMLCYYLIGGLIGTLLHWNLLFSLCF